MIYTLPPISLCLWFAEAASLLFLSALLIVANSRNRYPHFANLIHFTTGGCTFLLLMARFEPYTHFMWSYFAYRLAWDVMAAFAAREVYLNTFGPAWALPRSMPRRLGVSMAIVVTSAAAVAVILHGSAGSKALKYGLTGEASLYGALAGTFLVLYCLSRKIGITWNSRMKQIAGGMALILGTNTLTIFLKGHLTGVLARNVDDFGQLAYLVAFAFWSWKFLEREQPAPSRDPEILVRLAAQLKDAQSRARALGISTEGN